MINIDHVGVDLSPEATLRIVVSLYTANTSTVPPPTRVLIEGSGGRGPSHRPGP
jgi:hypothetical protein